MATPAEAKTVDCARVKCIALTFDDGPSPHTVKLLDTLKKNRLKVTFFLVGREVQKRPAVARRMRREGHEIANHTFDHARLTELPDQKIFDQLDKTSKAIRKATGVRPKMMRPPFGATDERVESVAGFAGVPVILWTDSSRDWELRDKKAIAKKVLRLARRDGVVLLHDIVPGTVAAMPLILSTLKKRGYHVVTVSEVLRNRLPDAGERFPSR
ncbi:polysaccharide deacetylase family protein [Streptosporangium sp. KLBMP 9127]|nr:polysaccharide deacetylase family protein [Streptosporangium sp. KLBMP 9127]